MKGKKLKLSTNDLIRHVNLLQIRILAELNISVRNAQDRSIFIADMNSEPERVIALEYVKESARAEKDRLYYIKLVLKDEGRESAFNSYLDKDTMSVVHDAAIGVFTTDLNGEKIDFDYEKLVEINNKILNDLRKPLNIGMGKFYSTGEIISPINLVALTGCTAKEQLKETTIKFLKRLKDVIPEEFNTKINFVDDLKDISRFDGKNKLNGNIQSRVYPMDGLPCDEYTIRLEAYNGSNLVISARGYDVRYNEMTLHTLEDIECFIRCEDDALVLAEFDKKYKSELLAEFSRIHNINIPKYIS